MARRIFGMIWLLGVMIPLYSGMTNEAQAQKKAPSKTVTVDSDKLPGSEYTGLLKSPPGTDRTFSLEVEQDKLVPTGKYANQYPNTLNQINSPNRNRLNKAITHYTKAQQHGAQAQSRMASARSSSELNRAQSDLNKAMKDVAKAELEYQDALLRILSKATVKANVEILHSLQRGGVGVPPGFKLEKTKLSIDFQATEEVKVRSMVLPDVFDVKGKKKIYTKEELAELKGKDKTLPGYESGLDKLESGQKIKVILTKVPKKDEEESADEKKKQVKMIVILEEAKVAVAPPKGKKNK